MAELPKVKEDTKVVVDEVDVDADNSPITLASYLKKQSVKMPSKQQLSKITEEFNQETLNIYRQYIVTSMLTAAEAGDNNVYINLELNNKKLTDDDFKMLLAEFKQCELTVTNVNQYGASNKDIFKISW